MGLSFETLKNEIQLSDGTERRKPVLDFMQRQIDSGKNCFNCSGMCCTFEFNSMQVTPLEALDAYEYLRQNNRINDQLINRLSESIKKYRLDNEIVLPNGRELRRHYTCPFYNEGPKGCSIAPEYKPYGCLAFNPLTENVSKEGSCTSNIESLENRESKNSNEEILNEKIRQTLSLYWNKKNFPMALLILIETLR